MANQVGHTNRRIIFWLFLLMFLMIFSALITAQEPVISGEKYLQQFSLCSDVLDKNPLLEKNNFSTLDEKAVAWFQFSYNTTEDFKLYWEWINPDGKLYHLGEIKMNAGNYQNYRTWYWIKIKDNYSTKYSGEWKVKIYLNDIFLSEKDFYIVNSE